MIGQKYFGAGAPISKGFHTFLDIYVLKKLLDLLTKYLSACAPLVAASILGTKNRKRHLLV